VLAPRDELARRSSERARPISDVVETLAFSGTSSNVESKGDVVKFCCCISGFVAVEDEAKEVAELSCDNWRECEFVVSRLSSTESKKMSSLLGVGRGGGGKSGGASSETLLHEKMDARF